MKLFDRTDLMVEPMHHQARQYISELAVNYHPLAVCHDISGIKINNLNPLPFLLVVR